jgi:hypothetical protein
MAGNPKFLIQQSESGATAPWLKAITLKTLKVRPLNCPPSEASNGGNPSDPLVGDGKQ